MMIRQRRHVLSIRGIVGGTLVLVCLGVNALGIWYVSREHELIEEIMSMMTLEHGRPWGHLCGDALAEDDTTALQSLVDRIRENRHVRGAFVLDSDGIVLAATEHEIIGSTLSQDRTWHDGSDTGFRELHPEPEGFFHETGHNFEFRFPAEHAGRKLGSLVIEISTAWGNQRAKALAIGGLATLLAITTGMIFLAVALDWRLRKAIKGLIAATRALAHGQLDERVRVGTGDELDALGDSVNMMADVLRDSEARVQHWHGELERTISQRTEELEQSQALLAQQEKVAALGLMAAGVAHEIGNPLAAISTILQRIGSDVPPKLREKYKTMTQQVERISKIVDEMRQFARPASTNERRVNINEALRTSAQICRYDPRAKRVKIDARLDSDVPAVRGNADRWQQVFLNLIFNALEAMPGGGDLLIVSRHLNGRVMLLFRDTGVGMTSEQIRNLFHPFYSARQSGRGFGLGLSVCQGIVNSYGGTIEVESERGRGTEFHIIIPAHDSHAAKGQAREPLQTNATKPAGPDVPVYKPHMGQARI